VLECDAATISTLLFLGIVQMAEYSPITKEALDSCKLLDGQIPLSIHAIVTLISLFRKRRCHGHTSG
jgi:hypothetical protein